jgi:myo-inositol-1(or 4)-monophosphatase
MISHPMLNIAIRAARRAGSIINRASLDLSGLTIRQKQHNDFVSEVDHAAEQAIIEVLHKAYPDHAILAEESGASGKSEYQWVIDPLDGTTNFLHGFPQYAVSIALLYRGKPSQAVVYDPGRNELFIASRGRGAYLNERRLRVSKCERLAAALIGTGFPFRDMADLDLYMQMFRAMTQQCAAIRRPGAAALDLAYVAAGRLDGFWEMGLKPWDMAAGALLIVEAGGLIGNLYGESGYLDEGQVIGGTPKVFAQLVQAFAGMLPPPPKA